MGCYLAKQKIRTWVGAGHWAKLVLVFGLGRNAIFASLTGGSREQRKKDLIQIVEVQRKKDGVAMAGLCVLLARAGVCVLVRGEGAKQRVRSVWA